MTPDQLLRLADQCVKCGLCLPHCPTYAKLGDEAESPRGRIALVQGWASGALALTPRLSGHLDRCLQCRACEGVCPSLVAYGRLADGAKAARVAALPSWRRGLRRLRLVALSCARVNSWLAAGARTARRVGLARASRALCRHDRLGAYGRLTLALAAAPRSTRPAREPDGEPDLELFVGCADDIAQGPALVAATRVLRHLGLRVRQRRDGCCGALLRHQGFPVEADRQRSRWRLQANDPPLVGLASACVGELREGADSGPPVRELCELLVELPAFQTLSLVQTPMQVAVHEPCSHRLLQGGNAAVYRLLGAIPGVSARPLTASPACCGAAGLYMVDQPRLAGMLLDDALAGVERDAGEPPPDVVVTTNPGCALHLRGGLLARGLDIPVRHPAELLADALGEGVPGGG